MRKPNILFVIIALILLGQFVFTKNRERPMISMEQTILCLLSNSANDAINDYYDQPRQYKNEKLLSISQVPNTPFYEAKIQVETFYEAGNHTYGIDTITFFISYGKVILKDFDHLDVI